MKKLIYLAMAVLLIFAITGCAGNTETNTETPKPTEQAATDIDGRIIEIVEGEYVLIRNEADTSIYYKIDVSGGLVFSSGVNENLQPDNVINAEVRMIDPDALPKDAELVEITGNKAPDYRVIDAVQAKALIDEGDAIIIDVRTRTEYEEGYIPDAYNVPLDQVDKQIKNVTSNLDDKILVYCRSGNRSKVAARILTEMGYTNVYDFGGIVDWPYEIIVP